MKPRDKLIRDDDDPEISISELDLETYERVMDEVYGIGSLEDDYSEESYP